MANIAFPAGVNVGYIHYDLINGGEWRFMGGGSYTNILNWLLTGGMLLGHPDTTGWGERQAGATWYNSSLGGFFGWNGSVINLLSTISTVVAAPVLSGGGDILVGQVVIDRGPNVNLALTTSFQTVTDIAVTTVGVVGTVRIRGVVCVRNEGAVTTFQVQLARNGVVVTGTFRQFDANVGTTANVTFFVPVEYVDTNVPVGTVYTLQASSNPAPGNTKALSGFCVIEAESRTTGLTFTTDPVGG